MKQRKTPVIPGLEQCMGHLQKGDIPAFERSARELAARHPHASKPQQLLGVAALIGGRLQEAVDQLQRAARLDQTDATIWDNLGVALQRAGHHAAAAECYQGSVRLDPDVPAVWCNASANFGEMGDYVLARNCAARALRLDPKIVEGHLNLGNALRLLGDHGGAISALLTAIELDPSCAPAHMGLARSLSARGAIELALKHARRAREIDPHAPDGRLAYALLCGFASEVVDVLREVSTRRAMSIEVAQSLLWHSLMDHRQSPEQRFALHRGVGERFEALHATARAPHSNAPVPSRPLRVAFVSGDLRRHPVAEHVLPLWSGMDRDAYSIHAYCTQRPELDDDMTALLAGHVDQWVPSFELSDAALAEKIRADGIDVLVDLSGHTNGARMSVLLRKPAPIQMHWIGYPSSTGLSVIDYYLADEILAPAPEADALFSEKLIRLPFYHSQQLRPDAPAVGPLPALSRGYVTFGLTGRANKINPTVIKMSSSVLRAVPDAKLLVADAGVADFRDRVVAEFAAQGIDATRLDLRARSTEQAYFALHGEIDIVLDTFPFGGGTSVSDGLGMGVPTLTLLGHATTQRMAAARLHAAGLHDWIAADADQFVSLAKAYADDLPALSSIRASLRDRLASSRQAQPRLFATVFQAALRTAWQRWCAGMPATSFDVPLEPTQAAS